MEEQIREKVKEDRKGSALIYNNNTTNTPNKKLITFTIEDLVVVFKIIRIHKMMRLFKYFIFYPDFIKYHVTKMNLKR
jgi:hypothetical protein